ncbi:MAG: hypothetical protein K9M45_06440 [Kiritimatiellales bacterium]|nr:hypothetical protein [Kiritimatiellales bacterium]
MGRNLWLCLVCVMVCFAVVRAEEPETIYKQGTAVYKSDPAAAFGFFLQAAEAGHVSAMTGAGYCYETGTGTVVDYAKSIEWYEKAAKEGSLKAITGLARIYASCVDPEFHDGAKAVRFAAFAARNKPRDEDALSLLAAAYARNIDFDMAVKTGKAAAGCSSLDSVAQHKEWLEGYGLGRPIPPKATDAWLFKAAENDSPWAMCMLARMHEEKDSGMHDYAKARSLYEKAGEKRTADDSYRLAVYYREGIGGTVDYRKAFACFEQASAGGQTEAYVWLGNMRFSGLGTERNLKKALECYEAGGETGDQVRVLRDMEKWLGKLSGGSSKACHEQGEKFKKGESYTETRQVGFDEYEEYTITIPPDPEKARVCFVVEEEKEQVKAGTRIKGQYVPVVNPITEKKAKSHALQVTDTAVLPPIQNGSGLRLQANRYYAGQDTKKDYKKALELFTKSYETESDPNSAYYIGKIHSAGGYGVEKNMELGNEWIEKAADEGSPAALNELTWKYATNTIPKRRDGAKAVGYAGKLLELTPNHYPSLDTAAAAYACAGQFDKAVAYQQKAVALLSAQQEPKGIKKYRERLELYKQGKPFIRGGKKK